MPAPESGRRQKYACFRFRQKQIVRAAVWLIRKIRLHSDRLAGTCTLFPMGRMNTPRPDGTDMNLQLPLLAQQPDLE